MTKSATSDNNTRTRVSNQSNKATKNRSTRNKATTSYAGYLAGDESMFIPSDTSDISDCEWIAGGFPFMDVIRERLISDIFTSHEPNIPSLDTQTSQTNIKSGILDDPPETPAPLDCPISITPAGQSTTTSQHHNPITLDLTIKPSDTPAETRRKVEGDKSVDFPIFEIVESSDENATVRETQPKETINTGNDFK